MNGELHSPTQLPRWHGSQRRIGLTGGIASGKSSIGRFLQEIEGLPIIDTDIYAREALAPGTALTNTVLNRYGKRIIIYDQKGNISINRLALSKIIFHNKEEKLWLEKLIHPIVVKKLHAALISKQHVPIIVLIIPLLFEANLSGICSEIWLVSCSPQQQLQRLMSRDKIEEEHAHSLIQAQWPQALKSSLSDVVIDNTGKKNAWIDQIKSLLDANH